MTKLLEEKIKDIDRRFRYYAPKDEKQVQKYAQMRDYLRNVAIEIAKAVPESRELSMALTNLEQVMFWVNAGIARNDAAQLDIPEAKGASHGSTPTQ